MKTIKRRSFIKASTIAGTGLIFFPDFAFKYCDENGNLHDSPIGKFNIMMGVYDKR